MSQFDQDPVAPFENSMLTTTQRLAACTPEQTDLERARAVLVKMHPEARDAFEYDCDGTGANLLAAEFARVREEMKERVQQVISECDSVVNSLGPDPNASSDFEKGRAQACAYVGKNLRAALRSQGQEGKNK
jgi:hypothetical protein